ncbi:ABC transporter ATP-binding protein [Sporolactobacillus kofuensis]|uniref:Putative hemin import ATP-binding protein HrtA n=1 Tax=Sporolactobacillus kofuensis TaxID=269672 RepID=A0ABW1WG76_9BACL|nr:ABC transporter ATP-binding protein [Sporolactobacillus kofuensis]MCO7175374.1 ABC transporter ATP-binding protein [Sporolactobacillus kofuensis]
MDNAILSFKDVAKSYPDGENTLDILQAIDFQLNKGEFIGLVGPSGAGKSTLLSLAGALLNPTQGEIYLDGISMASLSPKEQTALRLSKIGFIFQSAHLVPYLNVKEQLLFVAKLHGTAKGDANHHADELLDKLGLTHRSKHYPDKLSGGEQQRIAIARAMMNDPSLILADEPTASLDFSRATSVVEWLSHEVNEQGKGALMVTHDERMLRFCDRVIQLEDGKIRSIS